MPTFTCIIPFYNENDSLLLILDSLSRVQSITQVILVDDGSTNDLSQKVTQKFEGVELIKRGQNQGKSAAVNAALRQVKNETILMMDADYQNVSPGEIERILTLFAQHDIDMLLLEVRGGNTWLDQVMRKEILFTGFRILNKQDLTEVFMKNPEGYQLEVAINGSMIDRQKKVAWASTDIRNIHKSRKWGWVHGLSKSIHMEVSLLRYLGLRRFAQQVSSFATHRLHS